MQAQRESQVKDGDSAEEDETPVREKPPRPPNRRKKSKEPLVEEDIVDGFAILGFKTYDDLQVIPQFYDNLPKQRTKNQEPTTTLSLTKFASTTLTYLSII